MNVVPGNTKVKVDIRGISSESINRVINKMYSELEMIEERRKVKSDIKVISQEKPVKMDENLVEILKQKCNN